MTKFKQPCPPLWTCGLFALPSPSLGSHPPFAISSYAPEQLNMSGGEQNRLTVPAISWPEQQHHVSLIRSNSLVRPPPPPTPASLLAQDFAFFVHHKIECIRSEFVSTLPPPPSSHLATFPSCPPSFAPFPPVSLMEVKMLLSSSYPSTCALDPVPSRPLTAISPSSPSHNQPLFFFWFLSVCLQACRPLPDSQKAYS